MTRSAIGEYEYDSLVLTVVIVLITCVSIGNSAYDDDEVHLMAVGT